MKVFSVCGISKSGKTTTIEAIIRELRRRGYRVGSVKEIHYEAFAMDPDPASNTHRHREAGAQLVTARGLRETDILFPECLPMRKILSFYEGFDYVVLEGVTDIPVPTIVTAHEEADAREKIGAYAFLISGRLADRVSWFEGMPAISAVGDIEALVDRIEQRVYALLPDFPEACCTACGMSCAALGLAILRGKAHRGMCVADRGVELCVDGRRVEMVPFVQKLLKNAVLGVVKELDGYRDGAEVRITIPGRDGA